MSFSSILARARRLLGPVPGHSERPLRLLLAASLILPLAIFAIAAWLSYGTHQTDARDRLERTLGMVHEHAVKVFETFELSERYLEELLSGVTDEEIVADEAALSARIRNLLSHVPQIRDLWVIDAGGHPLLSGTIFPMQRNLDLSDRGYFRAHLGGQPLDTYISEPVGARLADFSFFAITRKRLDSTGAFNGIYLVSISPDYFVDFYSRLPSAQTSIAALVRSDGVILARYPDISGRTGRLSETSTVMTALRGGPDSGFAEGVSAFDGLSRIFAYRKLPNKDVFVITGVETAQIRNEWLGTLSTHLAFGIPATLTMVGLAIMVLLRSRREAVAYGRLQQEIARRESTERALRQSQKMEAVGRLTGGIAHDFNNLLTAIGGNLDLALRRLKGEDERIARSLQSARQASQRAATLVQRLLTFSRQHPQEVKAVDVNRLVKGMSDLLHRTLGEAVTIETVLAGGLWKCAIDANQLENALINLAVNARDAMSDGGRLTIETSNAYLDEAYTTFAGGDFKPGQYVLVAVSDTGTGMKPEVREHVFEPFFTTKPVGAGSGLGLSMVYGFVKQSNGHIQIYSETGEGTSIKIYLPRLLDDSSLPAWESGDSARPSDQPAGRNERILLVEDDDDVRNYVAEALREIGYRIEIASNAADALALLDGGAPFDLLFTDVVLPGGMNGRQLADKARETRPGLRVLFATGYTRNAIIHHGRLDPDVNLLVKPFSSEALARKLRDVLEA